MIKKLIFNPDRIDKRAQNLFLEEWFLFFLKKKNIKFKILKKKINFNKELSLNKYYYKIYKQIIANIYPELNKINKVNWKIKTWNFLLGSWLYNYIIIIVDRINLIRPILKEKDINLNQLYKIGKNASLSTNDLRHFTYNAGLITWNESLFARILYLLKKKKFVNKLNLEKSQNFFSKKKQASTNDLIYKIKIYLIKFFERVLCKNNKLLIFNTYIFDKYKFLKILLKLKQFPFIYSFEFFNNKIVQKGLDYKLRKQIKINYYKEKDITIKICKFLLVETLPTIYLEGFSEQRKLSLNSFLPKKIKKIFTSSLYADNLFKFWTAEQLNNDAELYIGQHGGGFNIYKDWIYDNFENINSKKRFIWGLRSSDKKRVPVGNFLIDRRKIIKKTLINNKKLLIVLPALEVFQRGNSFLPGYSSKVILSETQKIVDNLNYNYFQIINIKSHPADKRRELKFQNFLGFNKNLKLVDPKIPFQKLCDENMLIIFTYLSTEFFKQIALNKPCMLLLNENIFKTFFTKLSRKDFQKLKDMGILHLNGKSLANKVNNIALNLPDWWNEKKINKIKKNFCRNYTNPFFNENQIIKTLKT
jgi:putative transferase (TIGR04331 family)